MPNAHSPDKETLSCHMPRTLMVRLKKLAKLRRCTLPQLLIGIFTNETQDIVLTPRDYEAIAKATRLARETRKRRATRL